jgi:4-hydroxy-2-oxoheptanedioate aldolase
MASIGERLRMEGPPLAAFVNLIPSPVATQALAAAGADVVMIDQEHGPIGPELDAGAEGIVFPLVSTAESAAACVALTRYPPHGTRGWGPFVAHSRWGVELFDYLDERGRATACTILVETRSAIENIEQLCQVEGIDCMTIAPFDLSTDLGVSGRLDAPELVEAVQHAEDVILAAGIPLGGAALTEVQTHALLAKGYRLLWHNFDVLMLKQLVRQAAQWRSA